MRLPGTVLRVPRIVLVVRGTVLRVPGTVLSVLIEQINDENDTTRKFCIISV